jgi:hypothetical protein
MFRNIFSLELIVISGHRPIFVLGKRESPTDFTVFFDDLLVKEFLGGPPKFTDFIFLFRSWADTQLSFLPPFYCYKISACRINIQKKERTFFPRGVAQ